MGPFIKDFYANASTELISIAITVLIIDSLYQRRQNEQLKAQLIREMGSGDQGFARRAVAEISARNWLFDGSLKSANLWGAHLEKANLWRAHLGGAHLEEANLEGADLEGANLEGANLGGTNLMYTQLEGAKFRAANLDQANLERARYDQQTVWPDGFNPKDERGNTMAEGGTTIGQLLLRRPGGLSLSKAISQQVSRHVSDVLARLVQRGQVIRQSSTASCRRSSH